MNKNQKTILHLLRSTLCLLVLAFSTMPVWSQVICDTNISLSLDDNCEGLVTPNSFLSSDAVDESLYLVGVIGLDTAAAVLIDAVGTYDVVIIEISSNNFCGPHTLVVNDELGPTIDCSTVYLDCGDPIPTTPPAATDGCCGNQVTFSSPFELSNVTSIDDFNGPFATGNWAFTFDAGSGEAVSFTPSGNQLTLVGDNVGPQNVGNPCNNPDPGNPLCYTATACITVPISGDVGFDWANERAPGSPGHAPGFDPTAYSITPDGGAIAYTVLSNGVTTSGTVSNLSLTAGEEFCFIIGSNGFNSFSQTVVDNFNFQPAASDPCDVDYILRRWTATDCNGSTSSCIQAVVYNSDTITIPPHMTGVNALDCSTNFALDADGNPDPSVTGTPQGCNIAYTYTDTKVINLGCQGGTNIGCYKILRRWVVLDMCNNMKTIENQTISVVDDQGPTVTGVADVTISTDSDGCEATYYVPPPMLDDNCSDLNGYTVNSSAGTVSFLASIQRYVITNAPLGSFTLTYRAEDCCGNATNFPVTVTVEDLIPPSATCETFRQTSLTVDGTGVVLAPSFDDGSTDGCSPTLWFKAIRVDNTNCATLNGDDNPGGINNIWFDDEVVFCCEDLGDTVEVTLRVFDVDPGTGPVQPSRMIGTGDLAGHFNDCTSRTVVKDSQTPFISCPPNITVSCEYWFDANDLTAAFGDVITDPAARQTVSTNDPGNTTTAQPIIWGQDGLAGDNCSNLTITRDSVFNLTCGTGTIARVFTATDGDGRTANCSQIITITDFSPYIITDTDASNANPNDGVIWPAFYSSTNVNGCASDATADITGRPTILNDDVCALISVDSVDAEVIAGGGFCRIINRTWTITDLCNFPPANPAVNPGQWSYTQVISITDRADPVFTACPADVTVAGFDFDANCEVLANLNTSATDNCVATTDLEYSWKIFLNNTAPGNVPADLNGISNILSERLPLGVHTLIWTAKDLCGNAADCSQQVTVADSLSPNAKAIEGLAVNINPTTDEAEVTVSNLDAGSFDTCGTITQRLLAVPSGGTGQSSPPIGTTDSFVFDCTNTGPTYPDTVAVDFWVQDLAGNWDYVITYVVVEDNNMACSGPGPSANIVGTIENELGASVGDVKVAVGDALFTFTSNNGAYMLEDLPTNDDYQVTPILDKDPREGISTLDMVLISRHMLGLKLLDSPYKLIAADVDNDKVISTFDIIDLQRVVLFMTNGFTNNRSWRFVDNAYVFADPTDPFSSPFPEIYDIPNLEHDMSNINFVALKVGDVNCTADPNVQGAEASSRDYDGQLLLGVDDAVLEAEKTYTLDIKAKDFNAISGYQFTLNFDTDKLAYKGFKAGTLPGLTADHMGTAFLEDGLLNTTWWQAEALTLADDAVLFSLEFDAKAATTWQEALSIAPELLAAEAYVQVDETNTWGTLQPTLYFGEEVQMGPTEFALYPNKPNPFKEETLLSFFFPKDTYAKLTIYDLSGKELKTIEQFYPAGYHEQAISKTDLATTGVLYARLETTEDYAIQKMIVLD